MKNLLILSWATVNVFYMSHFKQPAPVRYFKKEGYVYYSC